MNNKKQNLISLAKKKQNRSYKRKKDSKELQEAIKNLNAKVSRINNSSLYHRLIIDVIIKVTVISILIASTAITIVNFAPSILNIIIKIAFKNYL